MSRRDQIRMTDEEVAAFLDEQRTVICATNGHDGWPHLMPLWYVVRDGELWAWTYAASHYLNSSTTIRKPGNALGGTYLFNYDLVRHAYLQQRYIAYYNSQCCGIAVEYQTYNYGNIAPTVGIPQDHRFNLSFTLAGIGSFSNLFGAFGGLAR